MSIFYYSFLFLYIKVVSSEVKYPIIKNINHLNPKIKIEKIDDRISFSIESDRDVWIGDICSYWRIANDSSLKSIGKSQIDYPTDFEDKIRLSEIGDGIFIHSLDSIKEMNAKSGTLFAINDSNISPSSLILLGTTWDDDLYEIPRGETEIIIKVRIKAKCGFKEREETVNYPDTLWEGTLFKKFKIEVDRGEFKLHVNNSYK